VNHLVRQGTSVINMEIDVSAQALLRFQFVPAMKSCPFTRQFMEDCCGFTVNRLLICRRFVGYDSSLKLERSLDC